MTLNKKETGACMDALRYVPSLMGYDTITIIYEVTTRLQTHQKGSGCAGKGNLIIREVISKRDVPHFAGHVCWKVSGGNAGGGTK